MCPNDGIRVVYNKFCTQNLELGGQILPMQPVFSTNLPQARQLYTIASVVMTLTYFPM